jgi:hypothetical protein
MGWDEEFMVVLFMVLMDVRGCSGSLGLGVGEGQRVRWGCGFLRRVVR